MNCRPFVLALLIALLLLNTVEIEARPIPSALDSTDRVTYVYDGPPVAFGLVNATAEIEVPSVFDINDVDVLVNIAHTYVGDITLILESPDHGEVVLVSNEGGFDHDFTNTYFNDDADLSILQGVAPYTGSFRPEEPLSQFNGGIGTGTWILHLEDSYPDADDGLLSTFELTLGGRLAGGVRGRVVSYETQLPKSGVRVEFANSIFYDETDENGFYEVYAGPGTYDLVVSYPYWCAQTVESVVVALEDTFDYDFELRYPNAELAITSMNILADQSSSTLDSVKLANSGNCDLDWSVVFDADWITAVPTSGSLAGGEDIEVQLTIDSQTLETGDYLARMVFTHSAENSPRTIPVFVSVIPPQGAVTAEEIPSEYALLGAYPNPFNMTTAIRYALPVTSDVHLAVYAIDGRIVEECQLRGVAAGVHDLSMNMNQSASGVYFAHLHAGEFNGIQKLVLIK